jgi:hypothetical protein
MKNTPLSISYQKPMNVSLNDVTNLLLTNILKLDYVGGLIKRVGELLKTELEQKGKKY